jgi:protein-L-isoaspartate O-methyltransferase
MNGSFSGGCVTLNLKTRRLLNAFEQTSREQFTQPSALDRIVATVRQYLAQKVVG